MSKLVWLVEEQPNPSTDYYLIPAFASMGWAATRFFQSDSLPDSVPEGQTIIFVRYVPSEWAKLIEKFRSNISEMIFFMDDDVLDISATKGLPLRYRIKLARQGAGRASWLKEHKLKLWVSTPYLLEKYGDWNPVLIPPSPIPAQQAITIFYHGSAAHEAEIRWLRPVIEKIIKHDERVHFEIIGGASVQRFYRGISRVTVVHPMKWPAYQKFLAMPGRAIGLAPVLDSYFNKARSYTKFFDITRSGAAGIYSNESAFDLVVDDQVEGILRKNDPEEWTASILLLLEDPDLRFRLARNAKRKMDELLLAAQERYKCLC